MNYILTLPVVPVGILLHLHQPGVIFRVWHRVLLEPMFRRNMSPQFWRWKNAWARFKVRSKYQTGKFSTLTFRLAFLGFLQPAI
jgi:hypothetical protein